MGQWAEDKQCKHVYHYFVNNKEAVKREKTGLPLTGEGLIERGRFKFSGGPRFDGFWYAVSMVEDGVDGHFFELKDAMRWVAERVYRKIGK